MIDQPFLEASAIHKRFDETEVLRGVDLSVPRGEIVCLLGPSGCGKTTLLRIVAGLEQPDQGRVLCAGEDITDLPAYRRDFGLMFQDYALFPHLSVAENIAFGLEMRRWSDERATARVKELIELVELEGLGDRKVYELSGGQQQRVALARSLAPEPRLLMLDEPLGSLDRVLRDQLLTDLRRLLASLQQTALYVTHDQLEAFAMADKVVLMNEGRIEQEATPADLYLRPATMFAAQFLGFKNILPARVASLNPNIVLETELGMLTTTHILPALQSGQETNIVIRPEGARVIFGGVPGPNRFLATLTLGSFRGAHTLLSLQSASGRTLEFEMPGLPVALSAGAELLIEIEPSAVTVLS